MVFVVLSRLPHVVDLEDLVRKVNSYIGKNDDIGPYRMVIDDSDPRKTKAVLKFEQGFDAMEAQRVLDKFVYKDPYNDNLHTVKAKVPANDQPYISFFNDEIIDIADEIEVEKQKREKEKMTKKFKHAPAEEDLAERLGLSKEALEEADIEKLEKLCNELKKKAEKRRSQSEQTSEYEHKKRKRHKSIHGEASGLSKMPKSPEYPDPKCKGQSIHGESSKKTPSRSNVYKRSRFPSDSDTAISSDSEREIPRSHKKPRMAENTASAKSHDSRKLNIYNMEKKRSSESRSSERKSRLRSELYDSNVTRDIHTKKCNRPCEDLRHKVEARRCISVSGPKGGRRESRNRAHVASSHEDGSSHLKGSKRSEKHRRSSQSSDFEIITVPRLLLTQPSLYLNENDTEFKEALAHILYTVSSSTERLQEDDKKLIIENYIRTVSTRLKSFNFSNLMSVQDIVVDYKLVYSTSDDKLLIDSLIKELQALGKGVLLPEIKRERLGQAIDEAFQNTNINELFEDVKPEIKTESTLEYEYGDGETSEVINIVLNIVPVEKRALPVETDPAKIADIKIFVSELKKTKPTKFFIPIRSLLNEMKLFIYKNAKVVPSEVILNRMVEVLEKILTRMLGPVKTRVKSRDVCNLFRNSFPYEEDREFVDMIIKWILDGKFDKGDIDELISDKIVIPKLEKPSTKNEGDISAHKQIPIAPTDKSEKDKEQKYTTNIPESVAPISKDIQKKPVEQTKLGENDDVIIKKESVDLIVIDDDDDDLMTENKPTVDNVPETNQSKVEILSDSEESVKSDDSQITQIIEPIPVIGIIDNDQTIGVTDEVINLGVPVKNEPVTLDKMAGKPCEKLGKSGEKSGEKLGKSGEKSGENLGKSGEKSGENLGKSGEKLGKSGKNTDKSDELFDDSGETIDEIRQYIKSEKDD